MFHQKNFTAIHLSQTDGCLQAGTQRLAQVACGGQPVPQVALRVGELQGAVEHGEVFNGSLQVQWLAAPIAYRAQCRSTAAFLSGPPLKLILERDGRVALQHLGQQFGAV